MLPWVVGRLWMVTLLSLSALKLTLFAKTLNSLKCCKVIAEGKPANNEEAFALTMPSGETLEAAYVSATATIGGKISFRRLLWLKRLMLNTSVLTNTMVAVSMLFQ